MIKLYLVCFCVLVVLVVTTLEMRKESTSFFGLADTTEIILNTESPVAIKKMRVTPGQIVTKGDTLVELSNYQLEIKISDLTHSIDELNTRAAATAKLTKAQMRQIMVEQQSKVNALKTEQQTLQAKYDFNQKLLSELKSLKSNQLSKGDSSNPIMIQIKNLKNQLQQTQDSMGILVDRARQEGSYQRDPLADQLRRSKDELRVLQEQREKLFIVAPINGLIGTVYFKDGEQVSPFTKIATLHAQAPMFINGFIHEKSYTKVKLGQTVRIESLTEPKTTITGTVTSVGSRIVDYPVRLRKLPDVQMWGRLIVIKIPENNRLLMGEKVIVSFMDQKNILGMSR
jgi:multidrug resistance efflux pump